MLWKIVIIFLCAMALVGMIGKLIAPGRARDALSRRARRCPDCGRPRIGSDRCDCKAGGR